jgi:exonuclease III
MVSLNIGSLPRHFEELRTWLSEQNIDLIALNETRLDRDVTDNRVKFDNYQLIRKDRNRYGGRVCIYLKNHINFKVRCDVMSDDIETIVIDIIKPNSKPFAVVLSYRPPESDPDMYLII